MKLRFIGFAVVALLATAACKSSGGGAGGSGGAGGGSGIGGFGGGSVGGAGGGGATVDCDCACGSGTAASLVCDDPNHPSFCSGVAPLPGGQCESALFDCGLTQDDIDALACSN